MGKKYEAVFKCTVSVIFEEDDSDGSFVLQDQAHEAFEFGQSDVQWLDYELIELVDLTETKDN